LPKRAFVVGKILHQRTTLYQEAICEKPAFTRVNKNFEQIFDEPSEAKAKVLKEGYR